MQLYICFFSSIWLSQTVCYFCRGCCSLISLWIGGPFEGWLLQYNHREFTLGSDHDLVHLRADFNEVDLLIWMQMLDDLVRLILELGNEGSINNGGFWLHGGSDWDSLFIDNDHSKHTLMRLDAIEGLLYFLRWICWLCHPCALFVKCVCLLSEWVVV